MGRASAVAVLLRWPNAVIAAAGVWVGALWADRRGLGVATAVASGAAVAFTAFANAVNDLCDERIDSVAHPRRPLPSGQLVRGHCLAVVAASGAAAVVLSAAAAPALGAMAIPVLLAMAVYSRVKRAGLPGNALVALLASLPFLFGAWSVGAPRAAWPLIAVATPMHLAREIAKDIDDARGDRATRRTLPVAHGVVAARAVLLAALLGFALALVPLLRRQPAVAPLMLPTLALAGAAALRSATGRPGAPQLLKSAMVCAVASLLAAVPR